MKKKRVFLDVGLDCDENRNPVGYHVIVVTPDEFPEYDICWDGKVEGCECA